MNSNDFFHGLQEMFETSFLFYDAVGNVFNYACIGLGFFGLFYWLNYQRKFNKEAENNPNQIK
jgi:hypothetical protein